LQGLLAADRPKDQRWGMDRAEPGAQQRISLYIVCQVLGWVSHVTLQKGCASETEWLQGSLVAHCAS
jgi:hypothetical protein